MKVATRRIHDFLANIWIAFLGSIASIIGILWVIVEKVDIKAPNLINGIVIFLGLIVFTSISVYSVKIRQENRRFRSFIETLHKINHEYRDLLSIALKEGTPSIDAKKHAEYLSEHEQKMLKFVCQELAMVFSSFINNRCSVTVKLITKNDGRVFAETYARNEEISERDRSGPGAFKIGTGHNTGFDTALRFVTGSVSHFHSADLTKEEDYRNERDRWSTFYKSCIVVSIRAVDRTKIGAQDCCDDVGFLCVDTMSTNRLNRTWHVDMLASFADQMYNFTSLMRGKYVLRYPHSPTPS